MDTRSALDAEFRAVMALVGEQLQRLRIEHGWTVQDMHRHTGITAYRITVTETALRVPPVHTLFQMCAHLGVRIGDVFNDASEKARTPPLP